MTLIRGTGYDDLTDNWVVPNHYNIAEDVADWHDRATLAMIWVDSTGYQRNVDWGEMRDLSCQFANLLVEEGVTKGDVVAVLLPTLPETAAAYLGVYRTGSILLTMSTLWSDEQIELRIVVSQASVVLTDSANAQRFSHINGISVIVLDETDLSSRATTFQTVITSANDPAQLYYTSGTSGPAKGILHAHRNLIGHNEFEYCHDVHAGDIFFGAGEWAWSYAKLMGPWRYGAIQFAFRQEGRFDPSKLLEAMSIHRVTTALLNPTLINIMRNRATPEALAQPQHFREVCSSSEPLSPDALEWFLETFGVTVREYYGSTESYPLLGTMKREHVRPGSTGRPLPGCEVALLEEFDRPVPQGEEGEICLLARSNPQYPLGIWLDPEKTKRIFGGRWYHTGDRAYIDRDGYWFFCGRKDDLIKTSGYRVGPYEIEAVLNAHEFVEETGIVGVPDPERGQRVHAFVVLSDGRQPSQTVIEELQQWVKDHHSKFAYPRTVTFLSELPKSATGKIQRAALRSQLTMGAAK